MVDRFVPCAACARHVKANDAACPFCGAAVPETTSTPGPITNPLSRAAVLFVGLTTAAACGGSEAPVPMYGPAVVPDDAGADAASSSGTIGGSSSSSGAVPEPTAVPMYGPAPQPTHTTSGAVPVYGSSPVPFDAGKN